MHEKLAYDTLEDFSFISLLTQVPLILATYPDHPVKSVAELTKTSASSPNSMFYGSPGAGTTQHLAGALFAAMAKVNLQHVATKAALSCRPCCLASTSILRSSHRSWFWSW